MWAHTRAVGPLIPLPAWGKATPNRCVPKMVESPTGANHRTHVVFTTLTEDKSGEEALRFVEYVHRAGARVVVADYPRGAEVRAAWKLLRKRGFNIVGNAWYFLSKEMPMECTWLVQGHRMRVHNIMLHKRRTTFVFRMQNLI